MREPRYVTTDDDTVYSLLSKRAARTPDDIIAEWQDDNTHQWRSATATEMLSRVREVAKGLLGLGVKAGTMVLIYSPTCYEWGVADFACAALWLCPSMRPIPPVRPRASSRKSIPPSPLPATSSAHRRLSRSVSIIRA